MRKRLRRQRSLDNHLRAKGGGVRSGEDRRGQEREREAHLVSAPIPNGGGSLAQQESKPGHLAIIERPQNSEGVLVGEAAGAVGGPGGVRDGAGVAPSEALVAPNLHEARREREGGKDLRLNFGL